MRDHAGSWLIGYGRVREFRQTVTVPVLSQEIPVLSFNIGPETEGILYGAGWLITPAAATANVVVRAFVNNVPQDAFPDTPGNMGSLEFPYPTRLELPPGANITVLASNSSAVQPATVDARISVELDTYLRQRIERRNVI